MPRKVGAKIAPLFGVQARTIIMTDFTPVKLCKVLSATYSISSGRKRIITKTRNFPTDNYIIEGVMRQLDRDLLITFADKRKDIIPSLNEVLCYICLFNQCLFSQLTKSGKLQIFLGVTNFNFSSYYVLPRPQ